MEDGRRETFKNLRKRAESLLDLGEEDFENLSADDIRNLVQELRVHQIELEHQNRELREKQERLEASNRRMYRLFNLSPSGYLIVNHAGVILRANQSFSEMIGVPLEKIHTKALADFILLEDRSIFYARFRYFRSGADTKKMEVRLELGGNKTMYAAIEGRLNAGVGFLLPRRNKAEPEIFLVVHDVTKRRKAENALRESESRFRGIIEKTPAGVCITDEAGMFKYVNTAFCELSGYRPEEILGSHISVIVPESDRNALAWDHEAFIAGEREAAGEWTVVKKNGALLNVLTDAAFFEGRSGRPRRITFLMDITARKRMEKELVLARNQALSASRAKNNFLAKMSHELRTPLNAIIGFSEVLQDRFFGDLNEKQDQYVKNIVDSGKHLLELINAVLDLVKIEAGKAEIVRSKVHVRSLLEYGFKLARQPAKKQNVELLLDIEQVGDDLYMNLDQKKMRQVLFTLLSNGIKYTSAGGIVSLQARQEATTLEVEVRDTGVGLSTEDLAGLFDDTATAPDRKYVEQPGSSLGLSISRSILELHGGRLWADSPGVRQGSIFGFSIPLEAESR